MYVVCVIIKTINIQTQQGPTLPTSPSRRDHIAWLATRR